MSNSNNTKDTQLFVGIDVGSTTTKIVAIDPEKHEILLSNYKRHNAAQAQSLQNALTFFESNFPNARIRLALTGSGAKHLAEALGCCYIQEVVANSIALQKEYADVGTAIELGGQDAKMIFFRRDPATQTLNVADMRMNGSCAGGTGAFIDEIASILKVPVEEFNELASQGSCIYDISGRCGVYAKTDIQPLLNQGISRQDLALSSFHAIAKQTIGGLAQGLDIQKPVVFEGGPLTFNPTLVNVFAERLGLTPEETLRPSHPEIMIAYGAAFLWTVCLQAILHGMRQSTTSNCWTIRSFVPICRPLPMVHVFSNPKRNTVHSMNAISFRNLHLMYQRKVKLSMLILALIPAVPPRNCTDG